MCFHFDCKKYTTELDKVISYSTGSYCVVLKCSLFFFSKHLLGSLFSSAQNKHGERNSIASCSKRRLLQLLASHLTLQSSGPYTGSQNVLHEIIVGTSGERQGRVSMGLLASLRHCCRMLLATFDRYNLSLLVSWK